MFLKYKIKDTQLDDYLGDEELFDNLEDIRERLINFHLVDVDRESLESSTLAELCDFEWEIQTEDGSPVEYSLLENIK